MHTHEKSQFITKQCGFYHIENNLRILEYAPGTITWDFITPFPARSRQTFHRQLLVPGFDYIFTLPGFKSGKLFKEMYLNIQKSLEKGKTTYQGRFGQKAPHCIQRSL